MKPLFKLSHFIEENEHIRISNKQKYVINYYGTNKTISVI